MKGRGLFWRAGGEGRWRKGWRAEGRVCCSELLCVGAPRSPLTSRRLGRGHRSGAAPLPANEGTGADTAAERSRVALPWEGDPDDDVSISLSPVTGSLRAFCREVLVLPVSGECGEGSVAASC